MRCGTLAWGLAGLLGVSQVHAAVTVYNQIPYGASASSSAAGAGKTANAYADSVQLTAPALPNPLPPTTFDLTLGTNNNSQNGLSIPIPGSFYGFSIEMSVVNQVGEFMSTFNAFIRLLISCQKWGRTRELPHPCYLAHRSSPSQLFTAGPVSQPHEPAHGPGRRSTYPCRRQHPRNRDDGLIPPERHHSCKSRSSQRYRVCSRLCSWHTY